MPSTLTKPVRPHSLKAWWLAARPKTLTAALTPVCTATALAAVQGEMQLVPACLCVAFAALMQVAANLINDLYDYQRGTDRTDRLGPERACAQGWISPRAMRRGIVLTLTAACAAGLFLLPYGGLRLVALGLACVVFAFLYSTLLSYIGCGDLLVWTFFGLVPVAGTFFVQAGHFAPSVWWLCAACGLVTDTLLVLNNYRDREQDALSGKRTLIVALGARFGSAFYLLQGVAAALCAIAACRSILPAQATFSLSAAMQAASLLPLLYLPFHLLTWRRMVRIGRGRKLNAILGETSRNMLLFALLTMGAFLLNIQKAS